MALLFRPVRDLVIYQNLPRFDGHFRVNTSSFGFNVTNKSCLLRLEAKAVTDCRLMPVSFQVWDDAMICHDDATEMAMVCQKSLEAIWWMVATPNHVFDMHGRHLKKLVSTVYTELHPMLT